MRPRLDGLDPEIALFVADVFDASLRLSGGQPQGWPQRRRIADAARTPWRSGGPAMARTEEHLLDAAPLPFRIRVHHPKGLGAAAPALVYVHGGGWCLFSIDTHDRLMREYAQAAGTVVVGVDYALSPEHRFPVAQDQCVETVRWLRARAAALGIDPWRLALGGDSAGANLALTTALRLREANALAGVQALLLNYGGFDPRISASAAAALGTAADMLGAAEMDEFWRCYLGEDMASATNPLAVPARAALHGLPPTLLLHGDRDVLGEQSVAMAARLREAGVTAELHAFAGAPHSFLEAMSVSRLAREAIALGAHWLRRHLYVPGAAPARAGGAA